MAKLLSGTRIYGTGTVDSQLFVNGNTSATSITSGALQVTGGAGIGGDLWVGGGNINVVKSSTNLILGESNLTSTGTTNIVLGRSLAGDAATIKTYAGTGTNLKILNNVAGYHFDLASYATNGWGPSGTNDGVRIRIDGATGDVKIINTTAATAVGTGALQVAGGVSVGGNLYVSGTVNATVVGITSTATNISGGTTGQLPYQNAPGVTQFAGPGTAGQLLVSAGATSTGPVFTNTSSIQVGYANNILNGTVGQIVFQSNTSTTSFVVAGTAGQLLVSAGTSTSGPVFTNTSSIQVGYASNISGGSIGAILYQSNVSVTTSLAPSTAGYILQTNGTGQAPTWVSTGSFVAGTAAKLSPGRYINGTLFDGTADITPTEWYHSNRDFTNGTLITTSIDYSVANGDPFVLQIRGNSYGSAMPFDTQIQGYIYNSTIINTGGYSVGPSFPIIAMNVGGSLCFWFARQTYWQGFNVHVYTAYGPRAVNKIVSITDVVQPAGGTKLVTITPAQVLRSDNIGSYTAGSAALTSTYVGFGSAGGALTGSSALTWDGTKLSISSGALATTAGTQIVSQRFTVTDTNTDNLEISNIRGTAGADWTTAGWRIQSKIDSTWMGYIQFNGTPSGANNNGISFGTGSSTSSANSISERMRIDSSGNVGIGTSSPGARLNVVTAETKTQNATVALFATSTLGSNDFQLILSRTANTSYALQSVEQGVAYRDLILQPNGANVGIGISTPEVSLDVAGRGRFLQNVAASSGAIVLRQSALNTEGAFIQWVNNANTVEKGWLHVDTSSNMKFATSSTERMRITITGAIAFNGASNYGTAGQFLQSNGNAAPTWVDQSTITAGSATDSTKLPLAGGTMTGNILFGNSGTTKRGIEGTVGDNDQWFVGGGATASNGGWMEIATGDDGQGSPAADPIMVSQYGPGDPLTGTLFSRAFLATKSNNTTFPNNFGIGFNKTAAPYAETEPSAKLHILSSTATGIGALPAGTVIVQDQTGANNLHVFRNTADNGTYAGIAMQDNNIGGYVVYGNGGASDQMFIAGYSGGQLQYGSADSVSPSARTTALTWNSSGNVGIGTTPSIRLEVQNSGAQNVAWFKNFSGTRTSPTENADWPWPVLALSAYGNFYLQTMLSFTLPNDAISQTNGVYHTDNSVWNFKLNGVTASGWDNNNDTTPVTVSSANVGLQLMGPGNLRLGTVNAKNIYFNTSNSDRVTIDSNGNVGIGVTPSDKLHVYRSGQGNTGITVSSDSGSSISLLPNRGSGATNPLTQAGDASINYSAGSIDTGSLVIGQWSNYSRGIRIDSTGKVGIGTNPSYTLDVAGSIYATQGLADQTGYNSPLRLVNPGGATNWIGTSAVTGAIKIKLPQVAPGNTMLRMTVKVYTYDGQSFTIECGGYTYSGPTWYNTFAHMSTQSRGMLNVRFGNDGSTFCIYIGELGSTWSYPNVFVTDFQAGYTNYSASTWNTGWSVSYEASAFGNVTSNQVVYTQIINQAGNRYNTDVNYLLRTGFYNVEGQPTNSPVNYGQIIVAQGIDTGLQIAGGYANDQLYFRGWASSGSTFYPWRTVLHSGNYTSYVPSLTGSGASGSWNITASVATYLNSANSSTDSELNTRVNSGYYQKYPTYVANGWPTDGSWYHAHVTTHSNPANYYSMQLAADFFSQSLWYRSTNNSGTTAWNRVIITVGTTTGITGTLNVTGEVYAYASDKRLKTDVRPIDNAINKVKLLNGIFYKWNDLANSLAEYNTDKDLVGLFAQDVQEVLPQAVRPAPFDQENGVSKSGENYLTIQYEKLVPLLIEAIKEQQVLIESQQKQIDQLLLNSK